MPGQDEGTGFIMAMTARLAKAALGGALAVGVGIGGAAVAGSTSTDAAAWDRITGTSSPTGTSSTSFTGGDVPEVQASPPATTVGRTPLGPGDRGARVIRLQKRLTELGYWNGKADGTYGELTSQAVLALQKAADLAPDGVAGSKTMKALAEGVRPTTTASGDLVEIDISSQLLLVVRDGRVAMTFNTSTASGETYVSQGETRVVYTPRGDYRVGRTVNGPDTGPLGTLYRPRYFNGGYAVHGAPYIPGYPASHGCARLSNAAMDMIWAKDLMPVGSRVLVHD